MIKIIYQLNGLVRKKNGLNKNVISWIKYGSYYKNNSSNKNVILNKTTSYLKIICNNKLKKKPKNN